MYWFWEGEIPDHVCDSIIQEGLLLEQLQGKVGSMDSDNVPYQGGVDLRFRKSTVGFFTRPENNWIIGILNYYCTLANVNAGWNFLITGQESPQFTQYGIDEYYDFHEDSAIHKEDMRKLSVVISISNPNQYKGGDFEFADGAIPEIKKRGSVLVFPSSLTHRVTSVTYGKRYSIVNWFTGPKLI